MNELNRHIIRLLETNECVIIPGVGGLVTVHNKARYDEERNLFLPPCRTLVFQAGLTTDDGLLAQAYMEARDMAYPEAVMVVDNEVKALKEALERDGSARLKGIGRLAQNAGGHYYLTPDTDSSETENEAQKEAPDFYGLPAVEMKELAPAEVKSPQQADIPVVPVHTEAYPFYSKKGISIHLSTSTLNKIAGMVIMFLLVFLFATPFGTLAPVSSYSGMIPLMSEKEAVQKKVPVQAAAAILTTKDKDSLKTAETDVQKANQNAVFNANQKTLFNTNKTAALKAGQPAVKEAIATRGNYCIVLASGVSRANAEAFIKSLKAEGIQASILESGKMRRVVYSSFSSRDEAMQKLRNLRLDNAVFSTAWILKQPAV